MRHVDGLALRVLASSSREINQQIAAVDEIDRRQTAGELRRLEADLDRLAARGSTRSTRRAL